MGVGGSKQRNGGDSLAALLERRAFEVLQQRTDRIMLVLDNVNDPAVELQILQCADNLGIQVHQHPLINTPSPRRTLRLWLSHQSSHHFHQLTGHH
jgi:hypothetical protein